MASFTLSHTKQQQQHNRRQYKEDINKQSQQSQQPEEALELKDAHFAVVESNLGSPNIGNGGSCAGMMASSTLLFPRKGTLASEFPNTALSMNLHDQEQRKEAAAQARRNRRQALLNKSNRNKAIVTATSSSIASGSGNTTMPSQDSDAMIESEASPLPSSARVQSIHRRPLVAEKRQRFEPSPPLQPVNAPHTSIDHGSSTGSIGSSTAIRVLHSDLSGICEIAQLLVQSSTLAVAVPTECTYEAVSVYHYKGEQGHGPSSQPTSRHVYFTDWTSLETSSFWKPLLVKKSYAIRQSASGSGDSSGGGSGSPLLTRRSCTSSTSPYQRLSQATFAAGTTSSSRVKKARSASLGCILSRSERAGLLNQNSDPFSPSVARNSSTTVAVGAHHHPTSLIAHFNETVQIVRRIAQKIWPGPILVYISVPCAIPGLSVAVGTGQNQQQHYVALRKPSHPLMVKVCQEYYHQRDLNVATAAMTTGRQTQKSVHASVSTSPPIRAAMISPSPVATPPQAPCTAPGNLATTPLSPLYLTAAALKTDLTMATTTMTTTTPRTVQTLKSAWAASQDVARRRNKVTPVGLLVGAPMVMRRGVEAPSSQLLVSRCGGYITTSQQALEEASAIAPASSSSAIAAILNGEEQRELFAVPTCEHGQPWPVSIWIDASTRTVRVQPQVDGQSPLGSSSIQVNDYMAQTRSALVQAIRTPPPKSTNACNTSSSGGSGRSSSKERILQAVMLQWNVA